MKLTNIFVVGFWAFYFGFCCNRIGAREVTKSKSEENEKLVLEDLIEVQKTYRKLKEKWLKIKEKEEKESNSSTTTEHPKLIDADLLNDVHDEMADEDGFVEITDEFVDDITMKSPAQQLQEIQNLIHDAFHQNNPPQSDPVIPPPKAQFMENQPEEEIKAIHILTTRTTIQPMIQQTTSPYFNVKIKPSEVPIFVENLNMTESQKPLSLLVNKTTQLMGKLENILTGEKNYVAPNTQFRDPSSVLAGSLNLRTVNGEFAKTDAQNRKLEELLKIHNTNKHTGEVPKAMSSSTAELLNSSAESSSEEQEQIVTLDDVLRAENPETLLVPLQTIPDKMQSSGTTAHLKYQEKTNFDPKLESLLRREVAQLTAKLPTRMVLGNSRSKVGIFSTASDFPSPPPLVKPEPLAPLSFGIERDGESEGDNNSFGANGNASLDLEDVSPTTPATTEMVMMIKKFFDEDSEPPKNIYKPKPIIDNDTMAAGVQMKRGRGISRRVTTTTARNETSRIVLPAWGQEGNDDNDMTTTMKTTTSTTTTTPEPILTTPKKIEQKRDVDLDDIDRLILNNDEGRTELPRCTRVYAKPMQSSQQLVTFSRKMGLFEISDVLRDAENQRYQSIIEDERVLEDKRSLVGKLEFLLALAESRALVFELLEKQKKLVDRLENEALEMIENFEATTTPTPIIEEKSIEELSAEIESNFLSANIKKSNLPETAEIVEPILEVFNTKTNMITVPRPNINGLYMFRRPLPVAPPTMRPVFVEQQLEVFKPSHAAAARIHVPNEDTFTSTSEEIVEIPADDDDVCQQVQCDFEKGDLCNFETSHDEASRRRRVKRAGFSGDLLDEEDQISEDLLPFTFRAWSIWAGRWAGTQRQIDIGPHFAHHNTHFAAVFLEPEQAAILSTPLILTGRSTLVRFMIFEASRGMRLRVCCDRFCPMETERGIYRGHRNWVRRSVTCPPNTQAISFECLNEGDERGACGVDEIFIKHPTCAQLFVGDDQK